MILVVLLACSDGRDGVDTGDTPAHVDTADDTGPDTGDDTGEDTGPPDGYTRDADGDGYGASVDCDDADGAVFPGATETCDGRDEDCDGDTDEDAGCVASTDATVADADVTLVGAEGAWAGWALAGGDIDGDGVPEVVVGAPVVADEAGAVFVVAAPSTDGALGEARWGGEIARDRLGYALAAGEGALVVGAPGDDTAAAGAGAVWIVDAVGKRVVPGSVDRAAAGSAVAVGDVDGDGVAEAIVGAPWDDAGGWSAGAAYVLGLDAATLEDGIVVRGAAGDAAGTAVAHLGDTDGDGLGDVAVGCPSAEAEAGVVVWIAGPVAGEEGTRWVGSAPGDRAGVSVAGVGDVDGDGLSDWAVGATGHDGGGTNAGAVWIVPGGASGGALGEVLTLRGDAAFDYLGGSVAGPGDLDGDGRADVAAGADGVDAGATEAGAAYVAWAPFPASRPVSEAAARIRGGAPHDRAAVVAAPGDLDGDAVPDLLVGAWRADAGGEEAGAVYVFSGAGLGE